MLCSLLLPRAAHAGGEDRKWPLTSHRPKSQSGLFLFQAVWLWAHAFTCESVSSSIKWREGRSLLLRAYGEDQLTSCLQMLFANPCVVGTRYLLSLIGERTNSEILPPPKPSDPSSSPCPLTLWSWAGGKRKPVTERNTELRKRQNRKGLARSTYSTHPCVADWETESQKGEGTWQRPRTCSPSEAGKTGGEGCVGTVWMVAFGEKNEGETRNRTPAVKEQFQGHGASSSQ